MMNPIEFLNKIANRPVQQKKDTSHEQVKKYLKELDLLDLPVPLVVITGTCGKGSTSQFLSSILENSGYRVGLIQSPHLHSFSERIQINRKSLSENQILLKMNELLPHFLASSELPKYNHVFLITGLVLFLEEKVDIILVESGIGGYADPCSILPSSLSIITNVHKDHEFLLGETIEEIAYDKSGVIRTGKPIITGSKDPQALQIIKQEAVQKQAPLFTMEEEFSLRQEHGSMRYVEDQIKLPFRLQVNGDFQYENAALAIKAALLLKDLGLTIPSQSIINGLQCAELPGRFQIVSRQPFIVIDGAHNEEEIRRYCETVKELGCSYHYFILSFSSNKKLPKILHYFVPFNGICLLAPHSNQQRLQSPAQLQETVELAISMGITALSFSNLSSAYAFAQEKASPEEGIFFTGSMFLLAEATELVRDRINPLVES
ncbi:bifunctional folylpolyglutamate synthase/dihydrofolate synthase [Ammoniphilus resinae]|uniref:tetrahydrofolate synthase n=1 Tax=Ammoniphilus resinae TaxID=861532 RepID=A0ABS4GRJ7_9BACL|nr:Mur ligase family protein [Ammoniphilus resinae]MBP1932884.1 dihydrofolate synthase/folylpolyglutamate synthase [Ammoniphilus resinae]